VLAAQCGCLGSASIWNFECRDSAMRKTRKTRRKVITSVRVRLFAFLAVLGPGFITANVDNDPGGILTYSLIPTTIACRSYCSSC
jgi:hypothetical protein